MVNDDVAIKLANTLPTDYWKSVDATSKENANNWSSDALKSESSSASFNVVDKEPDLACRQDPSFQSSKEPLPEQTLALEMMQKFHRSIKLYIYQCSVSWDMALENKPQAWM